MGKRGPAPGTGGRPRKALQDKILEGNPSKRKIQVLEVPTLEGVEMPQPKEFYRKNKRMDTNFKQRKFMKKLGTGLRKENVKPWCHRPHLKDMLYRLQGLFKPSTHFQSMVSCQSTLLPELP